MKTLKNKESLLLRIKRNMTIVILLVFVISGCMLSEEKNPSVIIFDDDDDIIINIPVPILPVLDSTDPDSTDPDSTDPDSTDPDSTDPDSTDPDSTDPDSTDPDSTDPDSTDPDTTNPDTTNPDTTNPDTTDPVDLTGIDGFLTIIEAKDLYSDFIEYINNIFIKVEESVSITVVSEEGLSVFQYENIEKSLVYNSRKVQLGSEINTTTVYSFNDFSQGNYILNGNLFSSYILNSETMEFSFVLTTGNLILNQDDKLYTLAFNIPSSIKINNILFTEFSF